MARSGGIIDLWLARLRGNQGDQDTYPQAPPPSGRHGFAEDAAQVPQRPAPGHPVPGRPAPGHRAPGRLSAAVLDQDSDDPVSYRADTHALPFASTGPQGHRARMRDRLLTRGAGSLADYELLEMLLFFAFKKGDTKPLAKTLINRFGSFAGVLAAPQHLLADLPGLGPHSVTALKLVQEAAQRMVRAEVMDQPVLNNWDRLMDYLAAVLAREKVEQFRILFLDPKNRLIADEAQARGTVNHTPVYPREVVKRALELHATAIILVHNHPSGDPTPSRADVEMTEEVREAAGVLGVVLHDHVIIGNGKWLSFRREGLIG